MFGVFFRTYHISNCVLKRERVCRLLAGLYVLFLWTLWSPSRMELVRVGVFLLLSATGGGKLIIQL